MATRRTFVMKATAFGAVLAGGLARPVTGRDSQATAKAPIVLSTWNHGLEANQAAWKSLKAGGSVTDAVEQGVRVTESDPTNLSVGLGGLPDREGIVTLDAAIMRGDGACGAVAFVQEIENPISLARLVMEKTPHVMLAGQGALDFALANGFEKKKLLTPQAEAEWKKWLEKSEYKPVINIENHDTIGMLALDAYGQLAGACTTSGLAYKMHGRVGDSPIIGAGLFVDNEAGAATATGLGESIIRVSAAAVIVELMRQGMEPGEACKEAVHRIMRKHRVLTDLQVGFLALRKDGAFGAYGLHQGFTYSICAENIPNKLENARFMVK